MIPLVAGASGVIEGRVRVYHRAADSNFFLGEINRRGEEDVRVIGSLPDEDLAGRGPFGAIVETDKRRAGLLLRLFGAIDTDIPPAALQTYLGSGLVRHVGPATARAILTTFGPETLPVLMFAPERLAEIRGLTAALLPELTESLARTLPTAGIVGLLTPFGVSLRVCRAVARRYGVTAAAAITAEPWSLSVDFSGVGFRTADTIALGLGRSPDDPGRLEAALFHVIDAAVREGHTVTPRSLAVTEAARLIAHEPELPTAIERLLDRGVVTASESPPGVGRRALLTAEAHLAAVMTRLIARPPDQASIAAAEREVSGLELVYGITFDPTQRAAVVGALERGLTIITGGPGTGKTTIVRAICDLAEESGASLALMSFTGKAAKRLSESTGREATTIHRYLHFVPEKGFLGPDDPADIVIVDEVSMLDVVLADELAAWLLPATRLILVGDVDQLPAIGPGDVLGDLVGTAGVPVFRLETIHRTDEASGIPRLAHAVNAGWTSLPFDGRTTRFLRRDRGEDIAAWIHDYFVRYRSRIAEFQVLAPMKKGPAGVENLNALIARAVRGEASTHGPTIERDGLSMCADDRIIWMVNDRELGLFNGQVGRLLAVLPGGGARVEFDGEAHQVPPEKVGSFALAYALTVHRAQGSEFPIVLVIVDASARILLSRRLLYTAVSRAREKVAIIGQPAAVSAAVARHDLRRRRTTLRYLLGAVIEPEAEEPNEDDPWLEETG
jgi:exodeoxyribonuclease V alpha subunit